MKCNQCNMLQISTGNISLPCHETGCPNTHKVWDEENEEWITPEVENDDDWYGENEEDEDWDNQDDDLGGTGHGDMSYSDADPGL